MGFTQKGGAVARFSFIADKTDNTVSGHIFGSQLTGPAPLPRIDSAVEFQHKPLNLSASCRRRKATNEDTNGSGQIKRMRLSGQNRFDDTHSRTYFNFKSGLEDVIYHSQAEWIAAQSAASRVSTPVTVSSTRVSTYDNLATKADRSYTTSPTGEKIYHSQAEYTEAQRAASRVSSPVTVKNHGQTYENLPTKVDRSYTTPPTGDKLYYTDARGVSSPITLDSTHGQTYENISPLEISPWSTHEPDTKLYTFNDHKIMFEIFEEEKEKWSLHGQTYSNLPTSSSDLPSWSIRESERTLYDFDTHFRCMNQESDSGYEADTEDNTDIDFPEWYFSRETFDFQEHIQLSKIFEAEKELLEADERLREIDEKIRLVLAERDQTTPEDEETEFEESDFFEQLQLYQPSDSLSPYSAPHDSEFSAASEMPSLTSDSGSVGTESEKDWSPVNVEETNVLDNVEIGEDRETSDSE